MSTAQLFFSLSGLIIAVSGSLKLYLDARFSKVDVKFDAISVILEKQDRKLETLIDYHISHVDKIARLEEKTKNLK